MNRNPILAVLAAVAVLASSCTNENSKRSPEAEALLSKLENTIQRGCIVGHQDDLVYGTYWNVNADGPQDFTRSDVKSVAGDFPGVVGFELGEIELGGDYSLDSVRFDYIRDAALKHYSRGGVVTFSWHCRNILTGGSAWDVSSDQVVKSILPGGEKHDEFMGWMDTLCDFLLSIRTEDGNLMPLIWRPWHEHTGGWFWWGVGGPCTNEDYIALWHMTYDYMVGQKGLNNLIWAISPDTLKGLDGDVVEASYPGDDYVDIIGMDCYCGGGSEFKANTEAYIDKMQRSLAVLKDLGEKHGKLIALTETGCEGMPDPKWWTEGLVKGLEGYNVLYALTWRNASDAAHIGHYFCTYPGQASAPDFKAYTELDNVLLLGDIK